MKLAIIGSRGFLVDYGGFETFTRKLVLELIQANYTITVYGLQRYRPKSKECSYPEVRRVWIPSFRIKFLEKVSAALVSIVHASMSDYDVVLLLGVSSGLLAWLPRVMQKRVLMNVDGIEWKRAKWSKSVSFFLHLSEAFAAIGCHRIIADSRHIGRYFKEKYNRDPAYISYGAEIVRMRRTDHARFLRSLGLKPRSYFLQICRIEPENNAHIVVREFRDYRGTKKLVIVGDTPHSIKYKTELKEISDSRIKFPGAIYGEEYIALLRNAYCYIHGHEAGGTNPVLLEAMAFGRCPIVLNVPYNAEVIRDCGLVFSKKRGDLLQKIEYLERNESLVNSMGKKALARVRVAYSWDTVTGRYKCIFENMSRDIPQSH